MATNETTVTAWTKSGRKLTWYKVQSIAQSDIEVYDGETYRNNLTAYLKPTNFDPATSLNIGYTAPGSTTIVPDEAQDIRTNAMPPRYKPRKITILTITCTHGDGTLAHVVPLDDLDGGTQTLSTEHIA